MQPDGITFTTWNIWKILRRHCRRFHVTPRVKNKGHLVVLDCKGKWKRQRTETFCSISALAFDFHHHLQTQLVYCTQVINLYFKCGSAFVYRTTV